MDKEQKHTEHPEKQALASGEGTPLSVVEEFPAEGATPPEPHRLTPQEIEDLRAEAVKAREYWDQLLRTAADFDNFKKRAARERQEVARYANESLLQRFLPILDNFENALASAGQVQDPSAESLQKGILMIQQQLKTVLTEAGVEEIDARDKPFDPNWHEAISQQERTDVPEGQVIQQVRKGYKLRDRLLRPAAVVVAKTPAAQSPE